MGLSGAALDIVLLIVALAFFLFGAWMGRMLTRYPFGRKPYTGMESLIGSTGVIRSIKGESMEVSVDGQIWIAFYDEKKNFKPGDEVQVKGVEGLKLKVEPKK